MARKNSDKSIDYCTRCAGGGTARELVGNNYTWTTCSLCNGTGWPRVNDKLVEIKKVTVSEKKLALAITAMETALAEYRRVLMRDMSKSAACKETEDAANAIQDLKNELGMY